MMTRRRKVSEKRYYWLKLKEDFFSSKRIKKIRSIAGGDTYTIIYFKMLLKALKTDGFLYFDGVMNDFAEELALDIDEKPDDVKVTLQLLKSVGLIEQSDDADVYKLTYMDMMTGSETAGAQRVRDFRERQKLLQCNVNVTDEKHLVNAEKEIEKEKEIEIDIEKEKRKNVSEVVDLYNALCPSLPTVKSISEARRKAIKARLNSYSIEDFKELFTKAEKSDFLKGSNSRNWSATFDWLIKDSNMAKVLDGNYDNKEAIPNGRHRIDWENV
jgi:predicted phage replisome organizer